MAISETAAIFTDWLFLFIWYSVQFVFQIVVILYVSQTTGWPRRLWAGPPVENPQPQPNP